MWFDSHYCDYTAITLTAKKNLNKSMTQPWAPTWKKANSLLGCIRSIASRWKEVILPLYSTVVRPHLECRVQACVPQKTRDMDILESPTRSCGDEGPGTSLLWGRAETWDCSTWKRDSGGILSMYIVHLMGGCKMGKAKHFFVMPTDRTSGHRYNFKYSKFHQNTKKCQPDLALSRGIGLDSFQGPCRPLSVLWFQGLYGNDLHWVLFHFSTRSISVHSQVWLS